MSFSSRALLASVSLIALYSHATFADDDTPTSTMAPVVVVATRIPTPASEVASSTTVVTSDQIAAEQDVTLPDVLRNVPGLNMVQEGGEGGVASVFMRGTNANHTKVLVDGIDVSDPTSPSGEFDFSTIMASDIERVEVLRGPQSGLYGSDAIGGVINIITKTGKGPAQFTASAEAGSFNTFNQTAGVSGSNDLVNYAFDVSHLRVGEEPVTPRNLLGPGEEVQDDYHDNRTFSGKIGANLSDDVDMGLVARYIETDALYTGDDDFSPYIYPDPVKSESMDKEFFTRATVHQTAFDGQYDQAFGAAYTSYDREDIIPNYGTLYNYGNRVKVDWQGNLTLVKGEIATLGAEHQIDQLTTPITAQMDNTAGFAQLQSNIDDHIFNTLSIRNDDNNTFGDYTTYRIAPAYLITDTDTKLKASYGTGFKAPSLNELFVTTYEADPAYNFYANPDLKPETSKGFDMGFEQSLFSKLVQFGSTYFHNNIKNLIAANDAYTTDINIGRATTYGFENFASYKPLQVLTLRADYTFTIARNDTADQELIRRPKNKASLSSIWQARPDLSLSATMLYTGSWIDGNRDFTIPRLDAGGYTVFNVAANYDLTDNLTLYGRIDNLLDHRYQEPVGFDQPGLGAYTGIKAKF